MGICCKMLIFVYFTQIGAGRFVYFSPPSPAGNPNAAAGEGGRFMEYVGQRRGGRRRFLSILYNFSQTCALFAPVDAQMPFPGGRRKQISPSS